MKNVICRLRLRDGDIVVVQDQQTMTNLQRALPFEKVPACPIVFAPNGIKRLGRDYLERLLKKEW